jgi:RND family efflux transporter MFP subunit
MLSVLSNSVVAQSANEAISVDAMIGLESPSNTTLTLTGTIEAKQSAQLAPLAPGRVEEIPVEIGDIVKKDQILLRLNNRLAQLEVDGARANVNALQIAEVEAKRLFNEAVALSDKQVVPQTLISERRALVASSQAQLAQAKAALSLQKELLDRHTLRAPFDGVISLRNVDVGEWINQQSMPFTLVADNNLRLSVAVPQEYYGRLAKQQNIAAKVLVETNSNNYAQASITRFVPVSDPTTRAFVAQIDLPESLNIAVGMSAQAQIVIPNTASSAIILPRSAIKQHPDGGSSVFVLENGKAKRIITPYTVLANNMVSIPNQPANLPYILTAIELLQDGTPVTANIIQATR